MKRLLFISAVGIMLAACHTTKYVPVIETRTDTLIVTKNQRDSINVHDSIYVNVKGDTVRIEKWHTKYIERIVHDTTYISKTDTVPKPYPVKVQVPRQLTRWQKTKMRCGVLFIALGGIFCIFLIFKIKRKIRL